MTLHRSPVTSTAPPQHAVDARQSAARRRRGRLVGLGAVALAVATIGIGVVVPDARGAPLAAAIQLTAAEAELRIAELADDAPPAQQAALADGGVSEREYRAAIDRTVACLRRGATERLGSATLQIHGPVRSRDGFAVTYSYTVDGRADPAAALGASAAVNELERACQERHQRRVEEGFRLGRLADTDHVARAVDGFTACVVDAGVVATGEDLSVAVLSSTDGERRAAVLRCLTEWPTIADGVAAARR